MGYIRNLEKGAGRRSIYVACSANGSSSVKNIEEKPPPREDQYMAMGAEALEFQTHNK